MSTSPTFNVIIIAVVYQCNIVYVVWYYHIAYHTDPSGFLTKLKEWTNQSLYKYTAGIVSC